MNDLMHLLRLTVWKFMGSSKPPSSDPCIHTPNVSPRRLALFSGRSHAPDFLHPQRAEPRSSSLSLFHFWAESGKRGTVRVAV